MSPAYLGDGVYAEFDGWGLILTTRDGAVNPTNAIYCEPQVYRRLVAYVDNLKKAAEHRPNETVTP
jgi:hypothetical protein